MSFRSIRLPLMLLLVTSCTRLCGKSHSDMTPEQVVEAYLSVAMNMTDVKQRSDLIQYTTGNLKAAIAQVSDDVIRAAYVDKRYKVEAYSVVERRDRTPRETEITFQLTYRNLDPDNKTDPANLPKITTENTVSVVRENKLWVIRDVLGNKKTSIDFPLAQGAEVRPSAPGEKETPAPVEPAP